MIKRLLPYFLALPAIVYAKVEPEPKYTFSFIQNLLCKAVDWIFTFSLIAGTIFVLFAAFTYMSSSGDAEKVSQANKSLLYAAIGLLVAILAKGVPAIVASVVGQPLVTVCP